MKRIIFLLALTSIIACKENSKTETAETPETEIEEVADSEIIYNVYDPAKSNNIVEDLEDGGPMLLGKITSERLEQKPFDSWFEKNYKGHVIDTTALLEIPKHIKDVEITVFMGTWCEDSQREVPALIRLLNITKFDKANLNLIAVNHDKVTPDSLQKDKNIEFVPTIIVSKDGKELNRFVEYAQETLEKDLLKILKEEPYKHAYAE